MGGRTMPETRLSIRVQPNARSSGVVGLTGGVLRIRVTAPAIEGRANHALEELLAALLGVPAEECRAYEDTNLGMESIRAAGMEAVDVRGIPGVLPASLC